MTAEPAASSESVAPAAPAAPAVGSGIAAVVLARDEAAHIVACLSTLEWAAERLVVVDARSRDATPVLAEAAGARVVTHDWAGWAAQRDFALETATQPWVFFVDADERVPPNLAAEAQSRVAQAARWGEPVGFWVPRKNFIMGRWMRHAGWSPDYQLRLFRRDRGRYDPARPVHELVLLEGEAGHLERLLVHHNYATWRQFWTKQRRYARAEAAALDARGVRARARNFVLQPLREFRRRYWTLEGYRSGALGLGLSAVLAAANFLMYAELWRLNHDRDRDRDRPGHSAHPAPSA